MKNCYRQTKKNNQTNLRSTFVIVFMTSAETIFFVAYFMTFFNYVILFYFGQFEIQKLRIYCDPEQNNRETACEIPGIVSKIVS